MLKPAFNENDYDHMRTITEASSVDSAANEIVSLSDMRNHPTMEAFTPNNNYTLRDAAHSGRRLLDRLYGASEVRMIGESSVFAF